MQCLLNLILQFFENCAGKKIKISFFGQFLTLKNMVTKFCRNSKLSLRSAIAQPVGE